MRLSKGLRRIVLIIAGSLVAVAVVFGVVWLSTSTINAVREADAKYYPVIGPLIGAAGTLLVGLVGGLGLLLTYLSRVAAIRTELYKKQSEAVGVIYEGIFRMVTPLATQVAKGYTEAPEFAARIRRGISKHMRTRCRFDIYLPNDIIKACGEVVNRLQSIAEWYEKGGRDFSSADYIRAFAELAKAMFDYAQLARDLTGTDHLTEGTMRMMGSKPKERVATTNDKPEARDKRKTA